MRVRSAGSTPAGEVDPAIVEAAREVGIDLSTEFPKPLTGEAAGEADAVITTGCGDACPIYAGKRYLDWDLPDPSGRTVDEVRPIRDQIDRRVRALLEQLVQAPGESRRRRRERGPDRCALTRCWPTARRPRSRSWIAPPAGQSLGLCRVEPPCAPRGRPQPDSGRIGCSTERVPDFRG